MPNSRRTQRVNLCLAVPVAGKLVVRHVLAFRRHEACAGAEIRRARSVDAIAVTDGAGWVCDFPYRFALDGIRCWWMPVGGHLLGHRGEVFLEPLFRPSLGAPEIGLTVFPVVGDDRLYLLRRPAVERRYGVWVKAKLPFWRWVGCGRLGHTGTGTLIVVTARA